MDHNKRLSLIKRLQGEPEPQLLRIEEFFDGNDDPGSIGCNLLPHPGIESFRSVLQQIAARDDVLAVYAQITEVDPGFEAWPFTDTVRIVGDAPLQVLESLLAPLQPDEIVPTEATSLPDALTRLHKEPVVTVWWD